MSLYDLLCCCCKPFKDYQELNINGSDYQKTKMPQLPFLKNERNIFAPHIPIQQCFIKIMPHPGDMDVDPSVECKSLSAKSLGDEGKSLSLQNHKKRCL
jgi:hypothetical protein